MLTPTGFHWINNHERTCKVQNNLSPAFETVKEKLREGEMGGTGGKWRGQYMVGDHFFK